MDEGAQRVRMVPSAGLRQALSAEERDAMVLINKAANEVTLKLVYYGPGLCGKTTNLEKVYASPAIESKGKMISMATETDRTLFFDFLPMDLGTIGGQKIRVQLYTVPGQVFYDATRKLVLRGTDGVVFVADSQSSMRDANVDSFDNLKTNLRLNRIDPDKIALVLQYNKRDLPGADSVETINAYLNPDGVPFVEASAIRGEGVTQTLRAAVGRMIENLKNKVDVTLYDEPPLARPSMKLPSGATQSSAGISKVSVAGNVAQPAMPAPIFAPRAPEPEAEPFAVEDEISEAPTLERRFDAVEPELEAAPQKSPATPAAGPSRQQLAELLASAEQLVATLERSAELARAQRDAIRQAIDRAGEND